MSFSTKFNTFLNQVKSTPLKDKEYFEKTKSFDEYITLTRQAAVESVGGAFSLYFNIEILLLLERYSKFFAGEFTEKMNDEFKEIEELFFRSLWSHEAIYVAYNEKFIELELTLAKKYPTMTRWKVMPNCKWRIYKIRKDGDEIKYTSLITGIPDLILDEEELIEVKWDNSYTWRFLSWWKMAVNMHEYETMFFKLNNVTMNRVQINSLDNRNKDTAEEALLDGSPVLNLVGKDPSIMFKGLELSKIPELVMYFDSITQWFYFNAGQLGLTGNTSEKTERMTTGDHVKDLKPIVNNQKCTLTNLKIFATRAKEKWGQELVFEITSMMSMDGSSIQINDAATPQGPNNDNNGQAPK